MVERFPFETAKRAAEEESYETMDDTSSAHSNGWAATYALILPIFFAPAQELETRFRSEATLYDVRNGYLYATAEAESEQSQRRAHLWIDREGGVEETRRAVVDLLAEEINRRLVNLAAERPSETAATSDENDAIEEPGSETSSHLIRTSQHETDQ